MDNIIYFADHAGVPDQAKKIAPMIRELFQSMGGNELFAEEVISEYCTYLEQLSNLNNKGLYEEQLNHACHIILGLLIKEKLCT
ncbi:hypothetical protein CW745_07540 [Psychromonas sp. psych-6C06]|uniref:hypothetical protein n=1 Tax=Psychromonas sp. psych-6C06 TaxID=2058089 RepID=UPI000C333FCD|nr:hypothetical protein [Psychromonas sp. psych-6C06]PKF62226.1 hypothetical protein CW745_07540 [Psychromonas sp. psych-6C06]